MTEIVIIAIAVLVAAIIIGKANRSNELILRLLFCFSVSVCVSVAFLYVFSAKPKVSAQSTMTLSKAIESDTASHVVFFDQIAMNKDSITDTTGQDSVKDSCLTWTQVPNMIIVPTVIGMIAEHAIFDSS